jgi:exonuclease SbcC
MIPISLKITGFLSYQQPVELDFSTFDLACISGSNGAGKSSLLDAITWVLFGQARKKDESVINSNPKVKAAEVVFTFSYEDQVYRVLRTLPRGKSNILEFQILQKPDPAGSEDEWRSLSEHTLKETQARILQVLRLDYDTFINAAFFLQGKADLFAQQAPGKRKDILGNILGLELWETYKERAVERRKTIESDVSIKDAQIQEIDGELSEEMVRKNRLEELEMQLKEHTTSRKIQESTLEKMKQLAATLLQQRSLVETLEAGLGRVKINRNDLNTRLVERQTEHDRFIDLLENAPEVDKAFVDWQNLRKELEKWEAVAGQFREHDSERKSLLGKLGNEQARLEQELKTLLEEQARIEDQKSSIPDLEIDITFVQTDLVVVDGQMSERDRLNDEIKLTREKQTELRSENSRLKAEMDELKERIDHLLATEGAICPLCGQPLNQADRIKLIDQLQSEGTVLGDRFRANKTELDEMTAKVINQEQTLTGLASVEKERLEKTTRMTQLISRMESIVNIIDGWKNSGAGRLEEIRQSLDKKTYLPEIQMELSNLDKSLAVLGYDPAVHDSVKRAELIGRESETNFHDLNSAKAAVKPLENEISSLNQQIEKLDDEIKKQEMDLKQARNVLVEAEKMAPDTEGAERLLFDLQDRENQLNQDVGAARQKVAVLNDLRVRRKRLETDREELATQIGKLKTLERAFGRAGVPALLIEQALPEIESRANDLLDRLSDGAMSVRFVTQSAYKDKKREDLKETLDILISDGAGVRDYEMFSGGEAFRVNFAIRLALSELLSHRKGARLQTLVIDEGFGSQDAQGRQHLIEAINAVRGDFAKVLVITHLDELKDAFQTRIEVTKTETGSVLNVV